MTENHDNSHDSEKQMPEDAENGKESSEKDPDIIELSDIAIGITPEDDVIVELTEEIIDKAFDGFTGATSEVIHEDERVLDLSETRSDYDVSDDQSYSGSVSEGLEADVVSDAVDMEADNLEDDISKELDNYFGKEEDATVTEKTVLIDTPTVVTEDQSGTQPGDEKKLQIDEIRISSNQLDDAVERVIRKMFAEKINRILDEIIERTVSEEISQLKDYLIGISGKD